MSEARGVTGRAARLRRIGLGLAGLCLVPAPASAQPSASSAFEVVELAAGPAAGSRARAPGDGGASDAAREWALYAATTWGLLVSPDGGASFRWVCDRAIGYEGAWRPDVAVAPDGAVYVSTWQGLRVSEDGGCTFRAPDGPVGAHYIDDVTTGPDGAVWAAASTSARPNDVYAGRTDGETSETSGGAARQFVASNLRHEVAWWKTIAVAPSDPRRVYVTGYWVAPRPEVLLYRSDDGGGSWAQLSAAGIALSREPQLELAAVSPRDPAVVFVRSVGGHDRGGDAIYRTAGPPDARDGAAHPAWTALDPGDAAGFEAFAVRADGALVASSGGHVRVSDDDGETWRVTAELALRCLHALAGGGLLGCTRGRAAADPVIWRSPDAATWQPVFALADLKGPLSCDCDTVQAQACERRAWPAMSHVTASAAGASSEPRDAQRCPAIAVEPVRPSASADASEARGGGQARGAGGRAANASGAPDTGGDAPGCARITGTTGLAALAAGALVAAALVWFVTRRGRGQ